MTATSLVCGTAGSRQCLAGGSVFRNAQVRRVCARRGLVRARATQTEEGKPQPAAVGEDDAPKQSGPGAPGAPGVAKMGNGAGAPKLTFGTNANAARGYTAEDSAGQSNIFAVEPKQYVQGRDGPSGTSSNVGAAIAGVLALGVVFAGLFAIKGSSSDRVVPAPLRMVQEETSSLRSLSTIKQQLGNAPAVQ